MSPASAMPAPLRRPALLAISEREMCPKTIARMASGKKKNRKRPLAMPRMRLATAFPLVTAGWSAVYMDAAGGRTAGGICAGGTWAGGTCAGGTWMGVAVPAMMVAGFTTTVGATMRPPQFTQKLALSSLTAPQLLQYT